MIFLKSYTALNMMKSKNSLYKDCTFNLTHSYTDLHISNMKKKIIFTANSVMLYDLNENENLRELSRVYDRIE